MKTPAILLATLALAQSAEGQRVSGRLVDLVSNQPIAYGMVTLMPVEGRGSRAVVADNQGNWSIEAPGPGAYYVAAKRLGYQPWVSGPITIGQGDDLTSVFHLRPLPVMLDPVEVSAAATRHYLELAGFYERQKGDFGHFMTPEQIEKRRATRVTDLLLGLPGVQLVSMTTGSAGPRFVQLRGGTLSRGGVCRPRVFVDGLMFARGDSRPLRLTTNEATEMAIDEQIQRIDQGLSLDDIGAPSTIAAVEVYRSANQVPVQFGGTSVETLCGVIVIWTRTGRMNVTR